MKFLNKTIYTTNFSKFYTTFPKVKGVDKLVAESKLPPRLLVKDYTINGDNVFHNCKEIGGVTIYNGIGKGSDVFLFKAAFSSSEHLFITMGHEFLHANYLQFTKLTNSDLQHNYINLFEYDAMKTLNFKTNSIYYYFKESDVILFSPSFNSKFHYSNFGIKIPSILK